MAGRLRLELLGGCHLTVDGAELDLRFAKSRALLCYLAVTGSPHSRDALTDLLWAESAGGDTRANLRMRLRGLLQSLPEHLTVTRKTVAFIRESPYELDVTQFLNALQIPDDLAGLREAVGLYRGDFLEGFHVPGAPRFETWLMRERERLRALVLAALQRLVSHHAGRREYGQARDDLHHFLSLDPWREDAHRQLMQVLALNDQREAAVTQYLTCCRVLAEELGLEPAPETTRLYEEIRAGELGPPASPTGSSPVLAERRQLTAMSCELTGVGALDDPEELHECIAVYHQLCATAVTGFEGFIAQREGPSVVAYFGYPLAHEDDARRAVRAGLDLLATLRASPLALGVRIGIQTGPVVVTPKEGRAPEVVGLTPVVAQRLQSGSEVGRLLIGGVTEQLVRGFFVTGERESRLLDGLAEPLDLYRVFGETTARSRLQAAPPRTALIGRTRELSSLLRCWNRARAGRGQAVLITGEAGIGKSRLLYTLKEELRVTPGRWLEAQSSASLTNSPFAPLIDLLERELGFGAQDTPEDRLDRLEVALAHLGLAPAQALPLLAALLALPEHPDYPMPRLSAERQRQETLDALARWLEAAATRNPVVVAVEDVHWCDPSTLDLLGRLTLRARGTRLLILLTIRPEGIAAWSSFPHVARMTLDGLSPQDTAALIEQLSGETRLAPAVRQTLQTRSDGVPLYVEELTREVLESGGPVAGLSGSPAIPSTLQDALTARLDRLGDVKEVLQLASVIGRTFSLELLAATSTTPEAALQHALDRLMSVGLIAPGAAEWQYSFRHALIQDAAYASLLKRTRQDHHARVARVLAAQFGEVAGRQLEVLAGHYAAAGQVDQALPLWQQAAVRALARSAHQEASELFRLALKALLTLPGTPARNEQELTLLLGLSAALLMAGGYAAPEVAAVYLRIRGLAETTGASPRLFTALLGQAGHHLLRAQYPITADLVQQLSSFPRDGLTPLHLSSMHFMACRVAGLQGEFRSSLAHADSAVRLAEVALQRAVTLIDLNAHDHKVSVSGFRAVLHWLCGRPDQALHTIQRASRYAELHSSAFMRAGVLLYSIMVHYSRREPRRFEQDLTAFLALVTEHNLLHWLPYGQVWQGEWQVRQGHTSGLALAQAGLELFDALGIATQRSLMLGVLARTQLRAGDPEAALGTVGDALARVEATGERWWEAELHRLKGDLLLMLSRPEDAERSLLQAVTVAKKQEAKSLELRATTSLARLWRNQGRVAEAHPALAGVYGWFNEGFDTPDLQEAGLLLKSVSVSEPA